MSLNLQNLVGPLVEEGKSLTKEQIDNVVEELTTASATVLNEQKDKLKKYLIQLSTGEISKDDFELLMEDMKALVQIDLQQAKLAGRVKAKEFVNAAAKLIINSAFNILQSKI